MERVTGFEVGVILPNHGSSVSVENVAQIAEAAEELGFDSVWATEHLMVGEDAARFYGSVLEPMSCLAWLAGRLGRVKLGTSAIIVPLHHPVHLAKAAATLQQISGGRFRLGIGAGWHEPEYRFLGCGFEDRGRRTDEALRLVRSLWEGRRDFHGEYWSFEGGHFSPLPKPPPELWVGGSSLRSLKRSKEFGAVWHPLALSPEAMRQSKRIWPEGRVVPRYELRLSEGNGTRSPSGSTSSMRIAGPPTEVARQIGNLARAGAAGVVFGVGSDPATAVPMMRRFTEEVAPRLEDELVEWP